MKIPQKNVKRSGIQWIGDIPNDWSIIRTKFCCKEIYSGGTPSTSIDRYWGGSIPWIPSGMCHDCLIETYDTTITEEGLNNSSTKLIPSNTVLIAMTGATCGQTGFLCFESCANQSVMCFVENKKVLNSKYLWFVLQSAKDDILTKRNGGAQSGINGDICRNIIIPFAKIEIQNRIVYELERKLKSINELMKTEEEQIEKLKEYKQSIITEVVTKGLDKNVEMKDSGVEWIGKIPKDWQVIKLKFLLRGALQYGANETGHNYSEVNKFRYIRITDIDEEGALKEDIEEQFLSAEESKDFLLSGGDVLFARSGATVGKSFIYYDKYGESAFAGYLIRAKCNINKLLPEFLNLYTKSSIYELWKNSIFIQATIQNIGAQKYSNLFIPIMSIDEQKRIINYLNKRNNQIDKIVDLKKKKIEKLNEYKKSLIYEYVTGKKEV